MYLKCFAPGKLRPARYCRVLSLRPYVQLVFPRLHCRDQGTSPESAASPVALAHATMVHSDAKPQGTHQLFSMWMVCKLRVPC